MRCVTTVNPLTNISYPQTRTSEAYGYTFAILGANADNNMGSSDPNGFVEMDYRSDYFYGGPNNGSPQRIYSAIDGTGDCSTFCDNYFTPGPPGSTSDGYSTSRKTTTGVSYLVNGYPASRLLPTAIYEIKRPVDFANITSSYNNRYNQPSNCPHATVHYFDTSGTSPLNYNVPGTGKVVADFFPAGTQFMALVYDGTKNSSDKLATVVGYVPIEVDGFSNGNPKNIGLQAGNTAAVYAHNKSVLYPSYSAAPGNPNTLYGHALTDIVQPDPTSPRGGCDFMLTLQESVKSFNNVRLVPFQPALGRYGVANQ
jgi:hypothetical protein